MTTCQGPSEPAHGSLRASDFVLSAHLPQLRRDPLRPDSDLATPPPRREMQHWKTALADSACTFIGIGRSDLILEFSHCASLGSQTAAILLCELKELTYLEPPLPRTTYTCYRSDGMAWKRFAEDDWQVPLEERDRERRGYTTPTSDDPPCTERTATLIELSVPDRLTLMLTEVIDRMLRSDPIQRRFAPPVQLLQHQKQALRELRAMAPTVRLGDDAVSFWKGDKTTIRSLPRLPGKGPYEE